MNPVGRVTALLVALLMAACAAVPQAPIAGVTLSGRLALHVDGVDGGAARSMSAAFELQGDPLAGHLNLSTPLGNVVAQARWAPGSVVLITPKGEKTFADLNALTYEVLGESLPVAALFDWLQGRPWPGAASVATVAPVAPGFEQLGWVISLARFDDGLIAAQRANPPVVTLRAKLDQP
ncbi:MAG TPA: outer membrane lipoprotein LolB [Burkholderiaceae bacterium]